ncbi:MAG: SGNH/GDSL hydrolase family protein [Marivivens sp.]|nr:SGNH/GDSL hydrolase family protein [Marivivens sp.]
MNVKSVLCYGDSNTHGQAPGGTPLDRFGPLERWPGVLRQQLGSGWYVIEEGLSGRTTVHNDPIEGDLKNGRTYLRPCLMSHAPLDLVILMLGTNDLKARFGQPASEVAMGIGCLIYDIKELAPGPDGRVPEIMVVAPPPMLEDIGEWSGIFDGAQSKSLELAHAFEVISDSLEVHFFDAAKVISSDPADGFHMSKQAHEDLGKAIALEIEAIGWGV